MKAALALFVKNESQDIAAWIAWHFAIGIEKLFIYDDHSTDGTYEIIKEACHLYNIELFRTDPEKITHFYWRQAEAYKDACRRSVGIYDWLGFLDGDEYISLEHAGSVSEFLSGFQDFNGIALSWRVYGSSHRVLKTKLPVYQAYTRHCTPDLSDCEIGKVLIRPEAFSFTYHSPHKFVLHNERYADALGREVTWGDGPQHPVVWENACINHYILRSMQNYVERIARRRNSDQHDSMNAWEHNDRNEIVRHERPELIRKASDILVAIRRQCLKSYIDHVSVRDHTDYTPENNAQLYSIHTPRDTKLVLEHYEGFVVQVDNSSEQAPVVNAAIYPSTPDKIILYCTEDGSLSPVPFIIRDDNRYNSILPFDLEQAGEGMVALRSSYTRKYLACAPYEAGGLVEANRDAAHTWEKFRLAHAETPAFPLSVSPFEREAHETFPAFIRRTGSRMTCEDLIVLIGTLSEKEKQRVMREEQAAVISWI